ncbi:MAG TPA: tyrosine-type recombinase/integrase [Solirubrobacteraceae bacterium]|nr:tyrosine-type recombinase/integrase [Solirubrobacteraceae bacterium]
MARPRRAKLKEDRLNDESTVFSAELTVAAGERRHITLGYSREGLDREAALRRLRQEEAKIALGQWADKRASKPTGKEVTFEVYASDWFAAKSREVSESTRDELRGQLTKHLIPFFGRYPMREIDRKLVKEFRTSKLAQRERLAERLAAGERPVDARRQPLKPLSNASINKLLRTTSAIFDEAVEEDELIDANPVGKKRLKQAPPKRTWLMPDELLDLLEAAERVDQRHKPQTIERAREVHAILARGGTLAHAAQTIGRAYATTQRLAEIDLAHRNPSPRRAIIATLGLSGPRASECCALDVSDVDLANRRLTIAGTKTDAAARKVKIVDLLRQELLRYKLDVQLAEGPLYPTATGRRRTKDNLRQRVLPAVVREANRVRRKRGAPPIREDITPHTLRRTFISLLIAHRRDVPFAQRQAGHKDPRVTLRIYTEVIDTDFGPTAEILELLMAYSGGDETPAKRDTQPGLRVTTPNETESGLHDLHVR